MVSASKLILAFAIGGMTSAKKIGGLEDKPQKIKNVGAILSGRGF